MPCTVESKAARRDFAVDDGYRRSTAPSAEISQRARQLIHAEYVIETEQRHQRRAISGIELPSIFIFAAPSCDGSPVTTPVAARRMAARVPLT